MMDSLLLGNLGGFLVQTAAHQPMSPLQWWQCRVWVWWQVSAPQCIWDSVLLRGWSSSVPCGPFFFLLAEVQEARPTPASTAWPLPTHGVCQGYSFRSRSTKPSPTLGGVGWQHASGSRTGCPAIERSIFKTGKESTPVVDHEWFSSAVLQTSV